MISVPPPFLVQQRASDAAYVLTQEHADRLTLEQLVRVTVVSMYAPERLDWDECGQAIALDAHVKIKEKTK